jgi:hypothetical protein
MCDIFHPAIRLLKPVRFLTENCLEPNCTRYLLILFCVQYPSGSAGLLYGLCCSIVSLLCGDLYMYLIVFLLVIVLFVLWFTASDFTFDIFKLYFGLLLLCVSCYPFTLFLVGIWYTVFMVRADQFSKACPCGYLYIAVTCLLRSPFLCTIDWPLNTGLTVL